MVEMKNNVTDTYNSTDEELSQKSTLNFNFETYDSNRNTLLSYVIEDTGINEDTIIIKDYKTDPHVQYNVCNIENIRKLLSKKIYVYKKEGKYIYDYYTQKIISEYNNEDIDTLKYGIIENPYCYDKNKSEFFIETEDDELVLPLISDDDIIQEDDEIYIQFLNNKNEFLCNWKRNDVIDWVPNTQYYNGNVIKYDYNYYVCKQDFISGNVFNENNYIEKITSMNIDTYLPEKYFPSLDIGYYQVDTNTSYLQKLNNLENQGKYLYNRDFLFYEITFESLFNNDLFAIPFHSLSYKDYGHSELLKKLKINVIEPTNAEVIISSNPYYEVKDNSISCKIGTNIAYKISSNKYYPIENSYKIFQDDILNISLKKKVRFIITSIPKDSNIYITTDNNYTINDYYENEEIVGKYVDVPEGTVISYNVSKDGYVSVSNSITAQGLEEKEDYFEHKINVELVPLCTLTIITIPEDANVELSCIGYVQSNEKSITVPQGSDVRYVVSKSGYNRVSGRYILNSDTILPISLENNTYTVTINPTPNDSEVVLTSNHIIGDRIGNSIMVFGDTEEEKTTVYYSVSKDGYETIEKNINGVSSNIVVNISLRKYVSVIFKVSPSDANVSIQHNGVIYNKKEIQVLSGDTIIYQVSRNGYETNSNKKIILEDTIIEINMNDLNYFVLETDDMQYFINDNTQEPFYKE